MYQGQMSYGWIKSRQGKSTVRINGQRQCQMKGLLNLKMQRIFSKTMHLVTTTKSMVFQEWRIASVVLLIRVSLLVNNDHTPSYQLVTYSNEETFLQANASESSRIRLHVYSVQHIHIRRKRVNAFHVTKAIWLCQIALVTWIALICNC